MHNLKGIDLGVQFPICIVNELHRRRAIEVSKWNSLFFRCKHRSIKLIYPDTLSLRGYRDSFNL